MNDASQPFITKEQADAAIERLKYAVASGDGFDWAYVECNLDPGEPDLQHDVRVVLAHIEQLRETIMSQRS